MSGQSLEINLEKSRYLSIKTGSIVNSIDSCVKYASEYPDHYLMYSAQLDGIISIIISIAEDTPLLDYAHAAKMAMHDLHYGGSK